MTEKKNPDVIGKALAVIEAKKTKKPARPVASLSTILGHMNGLLIEQRKEMRLLRTDVAAMGDCLDSYLTRDKLQRDVIRALYPTGKGVVVPKNIRTLYKKLGMLTRAMIEPKKDDGEF